MSDRDYQNKTIAQLLQDIDDKATDRSEVLPLLKQIERNTGNATATAIGTVIQKTVGTRTKSSGNPKTDDKLSSAIKTALGQRKDTIKDTAGRMVLGPLWDIGKELKEAADAMKDNAKDEKRTLGRMKKWSKGTRLGKAAGNAKDRVLAKYQTPKAPVGTTVVNNSGGGGGGMLPTAGRVVRGGLASLGALSGGGAAMGAATLGAGAAAGFGLFDAFKALKTGKSTSNDIAQKIGLIKSDKDRQKGIDSRSNFNPLKWSGMPFEKMLEGAALATNKVSDAMDNLTKTFSNGSGFFSSLWNKTKDAVNDKVQGAKDAYNESRANGDSVPKAVWSGFKGSVKGASGITKERYQAQKANIAEAAKATGMDQDTLTQITGVESNFNANAKAGTSSAGGLNQFTDATWKDQLAKNGAKYGLGANTSKFDPRANALLGAEFAKENAQKLNNAGFGANSSNLYMAHFLGAGGKKSGAGAIGFLDKMQQNPDAAPALDPKFSAAAGANKNIFYNKDGSAKSYKDIYGGFQAKMAQYSMANLEGKAQPQKTDGAATPPPVAVTQPAKPATAPGKKTAKPQQATGGGQKASGAGPASSQIVPNEEAESKPAAATPAKITQASGMSAMIGNTKSGSKPVAMTKADFAARAKAMIADTRAEGVPATATTTGTVVKKEEPSKFSKEQADSEYATAESEKKAALDAHWSKYRPQIDAMEKSGDISGATKLAKEANAIQGDIYTDYNKKTDATRAKEAAAKDTTATGTVVKKEEPPQPGQPATATALPPATPATDPSVATGTATMPQKQYGAGDIFNERQSIIEASKQKKAKMLSDFRSGKTTEAEYLKASAEEDKARNEKKDSLAALTKKTESGQFVSQEEMDKATGKATSQPDKVQALSATQPPLPEVQRLQPAPPPPMEVPAIDKLAKAQEQQAQAQQQNSSKAQDGAGKQGIPNIKTDFDDTMLVLMSYDRT